VLTAHARDVFLEQLNISIINYLSQLTFACEETNNALQCKQVARTSFNETVEQPINLKRTSNKENYY
jgi:hypothetical protein